jgi:hypothetical protein
MEILHISHKKPIFPRFGILRPIYKSARAIVAGLGWG